MIGEWKTAENGGRGRGRAGLERRVRHCGDLLSILSFHAFNSPQQSTSPPCLPCLPAFLPACLPVGLPPIAAAVAVSANAEIVFGGPPSLPLPSSRDTQLPMMQQRPPLIFSGAQQPFSFRLLLYKFMLRKRSKRHKYLK